MQKSMYSAHHWRKSLHTLICVCIVLSNVLSLLTLMPQAVQAAAAPVTSLAMAPQTHERVSQLAFNLAPQTMEKVNAAPAAAPLAQAQLGASNVLTITKSVIGNPGGVNSYTVTVNGPSGYVNNTTVSVGAPTMLIGLASGVYTVTENSPGTGWTTVYTATPGTGGSSNAVVTLQNANTATLAATPITGTVFRDFNSDGQLTANGVITDTGMSGVTVTAYDKNGNAVGSATSDANGNYTLTPTGAGPYRIEFSNLPTGYEPTTHGTGNGTSTQFVTTAAGASGVNFGVNYPTDYCQNNPNLCTNVMIAGDITATAPSNTLLRFGYGSSGNSPSPATLATKSQVGSTWGLAYARTSGILYSAAFVKRHAGMGPNGVGAIYATNVNAASTSLFVDMAALGINVGTVLSNSARGLGAANVANNDASTYAQIAKVGLGGMALSEDERTLYVINLNDKALYALNVPAGTLSNSYAISDPGCVGGAWRPFAVKAWRGDLYIGGVCDAQSSQSTANLQAYVLKLNAGTGTFSSVFNFALNYPKGPAKNNGASCNSRRGWYAWLDTLPTACNTSGTTDIFVYPQPMLANIEFDVDGSMILGFFDRLGHQIGWNTYQLVGTTRFEQNVIGGDILRAYNNNGTYVLESNGTAGPATTAGAGNTQGPGNGEFYFDDQFRSGTHFETAEGGLAFLPGSGEVSANSIDPTQADSGGPYWFNNTTGAAPRRYQVHTSFFQGNNGFFGKAAGLGDLELLCDAAPIEIGNRLWDDLNGDGIQDPGEPGLNGLTVSLQTPTGISTTVTSGDGNYYFPVSPNTAYTLTVTPPNGYNLTQANAQALSGASVSSNHAISDTRDSDAVLVGGTPTLYYTTGSAGQNNHGLDFGFTQPVSGQVDILNVTPVKIGNRLWIESDSDGDATTGMVTPVIGQVVTVTSSSGQVYTTTTDANGLYTVTVPANDTYTVTTNTPNGTLPSVYAGTPGDNQSHNPTGTTITVGTTDNLTIDFGFHAPPVQIGDRLWIESDTDGDATTGTVTPVIGQVVTATSSSGVIYTATTDVNGLYTITVPANDVYTVTTNTPAGTVPSVYNGTPGDNQSHTPTGVIVPLATTDNLTIDFGFHAPLAQFGDRVWLESDTDGLASTGSLIPIAGLTITATSSTGAIYTTQTNATGYYSFTVAPDTYTVTYGSVPGGYGVTTPSSTPGGNNESGNAGVYAETGNPDQSHVNGTRVTVGDGQANWHVDFAFHNLVQLGNRLWIESDTDGNATTGSIVPVSGQVVTATSSSGVVYTATTDSQGLYTITVPANDVYIVMTGIPLNTVPSTVISNTATDANASALNDMNHDQAGTQVTITTRDNLSVDFGFHAPMVQIGNRLWIESDNDGDANTGTVTPVVGQIVTATSSSGQVYTATTDSAGLYTITVPANATYTVTTGTPAGTVPSLFTGIPGDNQSHTPTGTPVTVTTQDDFTLDFGFHSPLAQFGDRVWLESDADGLANTGTLTPIAGMTITATNGTNVYTATTNAAGYYSFTVPVGAYTVTYGSVPSPYGAVAPSATPGGNTESGNAGVYAEMGNPDQSHANNTTVTLTDGQANWHVDFAFYPVLGSIGDTIWGDLDHSGGDQTTQGSEPGLAGVVVILTQPNGSQITATTSITGFYLFPNLPLGVYTVTVNTNTLPAGYQFTPTFDADGGNDSQSVVTLTPAAPDRRDQDFSYPPMLYDWGDLPDGNATNSPNYATLTANNGPSHVIVPGLQIGTNEDNELDGQPDNLAQGDDNKPTGQRDDEDGVTLPAQFIAGQTALITVTVVNTSGQNATLYGFIDWNGDGDFNDLNEQLTAPVNSSGNVVLSVSVPATATTSSELGARFRLSTDANLTANGPASNGEVEDYLIQATPSMSLGNRIWLDNGSGGGVLNDGMQNGSEPGLANVVVNLLDANGNPAKDINDNLVPAQMTDANGYYLFTNLVPGDYIVELAASNFTGAGPLVNLISSTGNSSSGVAPDEDTLSSDQDDNGNDTKVNGGIRSNPVTLSYGQEPTSDNDLGPAGSGNALNNNSNLQLDFGLIPTVNLGNLVWADADNDGLKDAGEMGINGVMMELFRAGDNPLTATPVQTTTTSGGGFYNFAGLIPGSYFVYIPTPPVGYPLSSTPTDTADNEQDNDDNGSQLGGSGTPVTSPVINLTPGQEPVNATDGDGTNGDLTVDFGFFAPVTVGDTVWYDNDVDGRYEPNQGEQGVQGVKVTLFNNATGLPVTTDASGNLVTPQTTDANGQYLFTNLPPGDYAVQFDLTTLPAGYTPTTQDANGVPDDLDSDASPSDGKTAATGFLPSGAQDLTLDMGIWAPVAVGDTVWYDKDNDGLYEPGAGESGVAGVKVTLFNNATGQPVTTDASGNPVTAQTTDANGKYLFNNLPTGDYYVQFDLTTLPQGYLVTKQDQGSADDLDSDASPVDGKTAATGPLTTNGKDLDLDMGIYRPVAVGDYVWHDMNRDGLQGATEPGVAGVKVTLFNAATNQVVTQDAFGNAITPQLTDANGYYLFDGLPPGSYYVQFDLTTLPAGYHVTLQNAGNTDALDSDASPLDGKTAATPNLIGGASDLTLDMGIWQPVSVGDYVWYDNDADGVQDNAEPGMPGVQVTLFDNTTGQPVTQDAFGNPVTTQTTDANGKYLFTNLPPGDYYVQFNLATLPTGSVPTTPNLGADDTLDSDANLTTGKTAATGFIPSGQANLTLDMGVVTPVKVGDYVWYDNDKDGLQDAGEPGVQNVRVTLFNADGTPAKDLNGNPVAAQTTDANGKYLFVNLPPGSYYVQFDLTTLPAGYVVTAPNVGADDSSDSDANPGTGQTATTPFLLGGSTNLTLDMGIHQPASVRVGDYVWIDQNGNGRQDAGEPGVPGVKVTLYDALTNQPVTDAQGKPLVDVTDSSGFYLFDKTLLPTGLPPGSYYVQFDLTSLPAGYVITKPNVGDDAADSDADATGKTAPTPALKDGEQDLTLDLGIYQPASLGDYVWLDKDVDGIQEAGEPAVPGVQVILFKADGSPATDANGNPVAPQTTDVNGKYQFTNLPPGAYYVQFTPPANYFISTPDQGADDRLDSDVNPLTGKTVVTTLVSGENDQTWDLGLYQGAAIGNYVWYDKNGNGLQEAGEPGLPNVTVTLYDDSTGNPVATTQTDANGYYGFSNLTPGDYSLQFTTPNGYVPTQPNQGNEDTLDSDAVNGNTTVTTLTNGEHDSAWDAGFTLPASIGSYVWNDGSQATADGIKAPGEPGMPGVTVILLDSNGQAIASTTTDNNGFFEFTNLPPGDYKLKFITPAGTEFTKQLPGVNNNSDANPNTGETVVTTLKPGQNDLSWYAGLVNTPTSLDTEPEPSGSNTHIYLPVIQH